MTQEKTRPEEYMEELDKGPTREDFEAEEAEVIGISFEKDWSVRKLRDGDTFKVAAMIGKVMGDEGIRMAAATRDENMIMAAGVAALFSHAPRDIQLFCADLIGVADRKELAKEISEADQARQRKQLKDAEAQQNRRAELERAGKGDEFDEEPIIVQNLKSTRQVEYEVDQKILEMYENYPPGTTQEIIAELVERDDFLPFVTSSMRAYEAGKKLSGRFSTLSSKSSDSPS